MYLYNRALDEIEKNTRSNSSLIVLSVGSDFIIRCEARHRQVI